MVCVDNRECVGLKGKFAKGCLTVESTTALGVLTHSKDTSTFFTGFASFYFSLFCMDCLMQLSPTISHADLTATPNLTTKIVTEHSTYQVPRLQLGSQTLIWGTASLLSVTTVFSGVGW